MAMAIRWFGKLQILAIHFEFGHSPILAIRWSGVIFEALLAHSVSASIYEACFGSITRSGWLLSI